MVTAELPFRVEPMRLEHSAENVALARAVGWPDVEADWSAIHAGALVLGVRANDAWVAQGALGLYGSAGTIAKMIVSPDFQRRGLGALVLDALLAEAERRSMNVLGLVATPLGRPLYEQRQFRPVGDVVGLVGVLSGSALDPSIKQLDNIEDAILLDRRYLGCNRDAMLRARFQNAIATARIEGVNGSLDGYALVTAQGEYFVLGPVVAQSEQQARALVTSVLNGIQGAVRIDVPGEQSAFRDWLCGHGFREQKLRPEMARGCDRLPWQAPARFALAAQAWG